MHKQVIGSLTYLGFLGRCTPRIAFGPYRRLQAVSAVK
jgi:hypothetical protein